jgi:transposase
MEACATSHHTVKLMPPAYVKHYVKRGKNDATDAEAICEAVTRPNMRFVPVKIGATALLRRLEIECILLR